jgi:hypothetical protein
MKAQFTDLPLSAFAKYAETVCEEAIRALRPGNEPAAVILQRMPDGKLRLVDGCHRTAGYCAWADAEEIAYRDVTVSVLVVEAETEADKKLIYCADEPSNVQEEALESLYAMAE